MEGTPQTPFVGLPAALVEEVLRQTSDVADALLATFRDVRANIASYRLALADRGLIANESTLGYPPPPTTCAVDGSYAIERLLSTDLAAAAAVAVEGLTPPSEKRHWEQPHHSTFIAAEIHHAETSTVLRAVMLGRELILATRAPHELVMIDGTFTLPVIYFNQAMSQSGDAPDLKSSAEFVGHCNDYLEAYRSLLLAERSDRNHIALPKYTTRRELGLLMGWPATQDDRALLTQLLRSGEFTKPVPLGRPEQAWHIYSSRLPEHMRGHVANLAAEVTSALNDVYVLYYKPHDWLPALRVEVPKVIGTNSHRLGTVIQGLKHQCATGAMLEPYPLYLADRTVKALARAVPAFRQVTTQRVSETYEGDVSEVFFAMHGYRSESGA